MATLGDSGQIKEGFLCPICMQDLNSVYQLQSHFEDVHGNEDSAMLQQLKGFFGKAKAKLLKKDESAEDLLRLQQRELEDEINTGATFSEDRKGGLASPLWETQELGASTNHFDYFKRNRSSKVDNFVVETNKLMIRLEKLVNYSQEANKRKDFEKNVVPWVKDSDYKFCPTCHDGFNLAMRRHHCRLCGNVMCNKCSRFFTKQFSGAILKPTRKRQSTELDLSGIPPPGTEGTLRTCLVCHELMIKKLNEIEEKTSKSLFIMLYERLCEVKAQVLTDLPRYKKMSAALWTGDLGYDFRDAEQLRQKLLKLFELVDTLSKKIMMSEVCPSKNPTRTFQRLQQMIRLHCTHFLQKHTADFEPLPSPEELHKLQNERRMAATRQIAEEKEAALEAQQREKEREREREREREKEREREMRDRDKDGFTFGDRDGTRESRSGKEILETVGDRVKEAFKQHSRTPSWTLPGRSRTDTNDSVDSQSSGWKPSTVDQDEVLSQSQDPMIQQMKIIQNYIDQATHAKRWDEVNMLEANLKDLQLEYNQQKPGAR
ncbi:rabenosyn-5-like [Amphiura filiformis]|uniref:rabenosyn-5-like n=1 Tax=Amphiura filiformis TaxID=82378 RepID=UPI003B215AE4